MGKRRQISRDKHLKQYDKNKKLSEEELFLEEKYFDWKITIIFYAALHLIDSTYSHKYQPKNHDTRNNYIESYYKNDEDVRINYFMLEELSRKSRYDCIKIKEKKVKKAQEALNNLEQKLIT